MTKKKKTASVQVTPDDATLRVQSILISLYLSDTVSNASIRAAAQLSPVAALVLAIMAINRTTWGAGVQMKLYPGLERRESALVVEHGLHELLDHGYIRFASKAEEKQYRDDPDLDIANVRFVISAAGARRIASLVGTVLNIPQEEVRRTLPQASKDWVKALRK